MTTTRTRLIACALALLWPAGARADDACIDCHAMLRRLELRAPALDLRQEGRHGDPVRCTTCHHGRPIPSVRAHAPSTGFLARPVTPCVDCHLGAEASGVWQRLEEEAVLSSAPPRRDAGAEEGTLLDIDLDAGADADAGVSDAAAIVDAGPGVDGGSEPPLPRPEPSPRVAAYLESAHAAAHLAGRGGPICSDCHLPHRPASPSNPASSVHWTAIPATCARCHGDPSAVGSALEDPVGRWARSVHGATWAARKNEEERHGPGCADCHDPHGTRSADEAVGVCVRCHHEIREAFDAGPHAEAFARRGFLDCAECHGNHEILPADAALITAGREAACRRCHSPGQAVYARIGALGRALEAADEARRNLRGADEALRSDAAEEVAALVDAVHRLDVDEVETRSAALVALAPAAPPPEEPAQEPTASVPTRPIILALVALAIGIVFAWTRWRRKS